MDAVAPAPAPTPAPLRRMDRMEPAKEKAEAKPVPAGESLERSVAKKLSVKADAEESFQRVAGAGGAGGAGGARATIAAFLERVADTLRWLRAAGGQAADVARELEVRLRLLLEEMAAARVPHAEMRLLE